MIRQTTDEENELFTRSISYCPSRSFRGLTDGSAYIGFDHWTPNSAQMHVWAPKGRLSPLLIREAFRYLFVIGNRKLAIGVIPGDNKASIRLTRHVGFRETHRVPDGWSDGVDLVVLEMHRDWCPWL